MEEKIEQAYLYDFYGELLNEHQRKIYEDFVFNDLSLGEIADEEGISRQGVHDMVKRCTKTLEGYESKLHLIEKFQTARGMVTKIHTLTKEKLSVLLNIVRKLIRLKAIMLNSHE